MVNYEAINNVKRVIDRQIIGMSSDELRRAYELLEFVHELGELRVESRLEIVAQMVADELAVRQRLENISTSY